MSAPCSRKSLLACVALAALASSCVHGRIGLFEVHPNPACKGEPVHISYVTAAGNPRLQTEPPIAGLDFDARATQDVITITAEQDTTVTFTARGPESSETRTIRLTVRDPEEPVLLAPTGSCPGPAWRASLPADGWPETGRVTTVTNLEPVNVIVQHLGSTFALGPAGTATASTAVPSGVSLIGDWDLSRPLTALESCPASCGRLGGDACPVFPAIRIEVRWRCGP